MSSRPRSRVLALALSLVPGWGHIYWGRELVGISLFTAFSVAAFALLNGLFVYVGPGRTGLIRLSLVFLVGAVAGSWLDILRRTSLRRVKAAERAREENIREGMVAYVRGDLDGARARFSSCLSADPLDVEALFRLGMAYSRAGNSRQAVLCLRRTLKYDGEEKWRWESKRELERLSARGAAAEAPSRGQRAQSRAVEDKAIDKNPV